MRAYSAQIINLLNQRMSQGFPSTGQKNSESDDEGSVDCRKMRRDAIFGRQPSSPQGGHASQPHGFDSSAARSRSTTYDGGARLRNLRQSDAVKAAFMFLFAAQTHA